MMLKLQQRIKALDDLVRAGSTGNPSQLAQKLGMTERAWYKLRVQLVEDLQFPILYDPERQTYYYAEPGQIQFGFVREPEEN